MVRGINAIRIVSVVILIGGMAVSGWPSGECSVNVHRHRIH